MIAELKCMYTQGFKGVMSIIRRCVCRWICLEGVRSGHAQRSRAMTSRASAVRKLRSILQLCGTKSRPPVAAECAQRRIGVLSFEVRGALCIENFRSSRVDSAREATHRAAAAQSHSFSRTSFDYSRHLARFQLAKQT